MFITDTSYFQPQKSRWRRLPKLKPTSQSDQKFYLWGRSIIWWEIRRMQSRMSPVRQRVRTLTPWCLAPGRLEVQIATSYSGMCTAKIWSLILVKHVLPMLHSIVWYCLHWLVCYYDSKMTPSRISFVCIRSWYVMSKSVWIVASQHISGFQGLYVWTFLVMVMMELLHMMIDWEVWLLSRVIWCHL